MLSDFNKLMTFLTVARERSFSKASAKLGVSQPAVTQQIKYIEEYLQARILERKKNGIILTKEGEELYRTALKLEKCLISAEKELMKIFHKELSFVVSASFTIGGYVLPHYLAAIKESINNEVYINIKSSEQAIEDLLNNKCDMALIESPVFRDGIIYREWMEDELVLFSNQPLPKTVKPEQMKTFNWICREDGSHTKKIVGEALEECGLPYDMDGFNVRSTLSDSTAVKHTVMYSPKDEAAPYVSIISRFVIEEELKNGQLFEARVKGGKITRKLYIAYLKERKHDAYINSVVGHLLNLRR
ncbi:MAG: LysR family transcriptional regulator [Campylobacterales bacterium]